MIFSVVSTFHRQWSVNWQLSVDGPCNQSRLWLIIFLLNTTACIVFMFQFFFSIGILFCLKLAVFWSTNYSFHFPSYVSIYLYQITSFPKQIDRIEASWKQMQQPSVSIETKQKTIVHRSHQSSPTFANHFSFLSLSLRRPNPTLVITLKYQSASTFQINKTFLKQKHATNSNCCCVPRRVCSPAIRYRAMPLKRMGAHQLPFR